MKTTTIALIAALSIPFGSAAESDDFRSNLLLKPTFDYMRINNAVEFCLGKETSSRWEREVATASNVLDIALGGPSDSRNISKVAEPFIFSMMEAETQTLKDMGKNLYCEMVLDYIRDSGYHLNDYIK